MLTIIVEKILATIVALICFVFFIFFQTRRHKKYFRSRNVPFATVRPFQVWKYLSGEITFVEREQALYKEALKREAKASKTCRLGFVGISEFGALTSYYLTDLDLVRDVLEQDFEHFSERRKVVSDHSAVTLKKMLSNMEGDTWRDVRSKLCPMLSEKSKIEEMFPIFEKSSRRMTHYLSKILQSSGKSSVEVNIYEVLRKYTMDVIASSAFGVDSKCFDSAPGVPSEFEEMAQEFQSKVEPLRIFKIFLLSFAPSLARSLGLESFSSVPQTFFRDIVMKVLQRRKLSGERRNDFLQMMMDMRDHDHGHGHVAFREGSGSGPLVEAENQISEFENLENQISIDDEMIVANCIGFMTEGLDKLLSLLGWATYALALESHCQSYVAKEVKENVAAAGGTLSYENITKMEYLDCFIKETLRYHSPVSRLERRCVKDYEIPGTNVVIEKDKIVVIPILGFHQDKKYFANPETFNPRRFLSSHHHDEDGNLLNDIQIHPFAFSPFGKGPRDCPGRELALIQAKTAIIALTQKFRVEPSSKTCVPPKLANSMVKKPKNGEIWLKLSARQ